MDQLTCVLFVNQMTDMLHAEDIEGFINLFRPNAELILPNAYCVGRDAIRHAVTGMYQTYEQISIDVERVLAQGSVALVQWRWSDRKRLTGHKNETETALVLEFEGQKIKRWREYHSPVLK